MTKQITVNQHYVPQFYMKFFSTVINEGTKQEKMLISFYQFKNMFCKDNIPTKSVCSEDYFYDKDGHVENKLAEKESIWNYAITKANGDGLLSESEVNIIKEFIVYQLIRTKATLKHSREMAFTIMNDSFVNYYDRCDENIMRKMIEDEITPEFALNIIKDILPIINDLDMAIIFNKTEIPFITSDVPIIFINPLGIYRAGLGDIGEVIFFPISESKLIVLYDKKLFKDIPEEIKDEKIIHTLNKYQYISADERILSLKSDIFATYTNDEELNEKRKKFHSYKKTKSEFDGWGTFFAAKSRSLEYCYNISLFKLPKQLRKIPKEFRETFSRIYSHKTRTAILCRIYRKPDFLESDEGMCYWKQQQKYSKILLSYLDYYWNTPKEERIISGEFMHKLKTVPVQKLKL